jgi:hypothetical protein
LLRAGRFARAAVFAGAALGGCDQGKVAEPAPERTPVKQPRTASRVHGTVVDQSGAPLVETTVGLATAQHNLTTRTDKLGRYVFESVEPGEYSISFNYYAPGDAGEKRGHDTRQVSVSAGFDQRVDARLEVSEMPVAMPYGAPPARRRIA